MNAEQTSSVNTFNMRDLADSVASQFDLTKQQGGHVTNFIFEKIKNELELGRQVRLHHFATFEARERAAGVARNPSTGANLVVPKRRVIKMTVSKSFKRRVANLTSAAK